MNCPVCKYPNPQGATHCGMCYEVFNQSAAQTYLRLAKRNRREEKPAEAPKKTVLPEKPLEKAGATFKKIDWLALRQSLAALFQRMKKPLAIAAGLFSLWLLAGYFLDPALWFRHFGKKFAYAYSDKAPIHYRIGMTQDIKSWSERGGRLDTPLEEYKVEELGNILFERKKTEGGRPLVALRAQEWIQIFHDAKGSQSRTIPPTHASLAGVSAVLDDTGAILNRRYVLSPRLAKGLPFLTLPFPKGRLRPGRTWTETVEWVDMYKDWKIDWSGNLQWTLGALQPCGDSTCAALTYQGHLHPLLKGAPLWAVRVVQQAQGQVRTQGLALFDPVHKTLISTIFSYDSLLRIPIRDLGAIPRAMRVGRRVKKTAGEIILRVESHIDIHKS